MVRVRAVRQILPMPIDRPWTDMDAEIEPETTRTTPSSAFPFELDGSAVLWVWYAFLVVFCCWGNIVHLACMWRKTRPANDTYSQAMRILAVPWIINCAYRSLFPSLYLQRYVFWDTPLNGILVDRGLAFVGELCFVFQTSLALRHVDREIAGGPRLWVQASGWLAFVVYMSSLPKHAAITMWPPPTSCGAP